MFSQELMDIFRIENSVTDLDEQVDKRSVPTTPPTLSPAATPPSQQMQTKC
jgi:hypothetical protein